MVKIYIKRIINGTMLWTDVPSLWMEQVKAQLEADGYQLNDDGTVELKPINPVETEPSEVVE